VIVLLLLLSLCGIVDVSQAGEGQLEITVNNGMVRNSVRPLSNGIFAVTFTPLDSRPHLIDILFNGERIPRKYRPKTLTFV
jgi:filamin